MMFGGDHVLLSIWVTVFMYWCESDAFMLTEIFNFWYLNRAKWFKYMWVPSTCEQFTHNIQPKLNEFSLTESLLFKHSRRLSYKHHFIHKYKQKNRDIRTCLCPMICDRWQRIEVILSSLISLIRQLNKKKRNTTGGKKKIHIHQQSGAAVQLHIFFCSSVLKGETEYFLKATQNSF